MAGGGDGVIEQQRDNIRADGANDGKAKADEIAPDERCRARGEPKEQIDQRHPGADEDHQKAGQPQRLVWRFRRVSAAEKGGQRYQKRQQQEQHAIAQPGDTLAGGRYPEDEAAFIGQSQFLLIAHWFPPSQTPTTTHALLCITSERLSRRAAEQKKRLSPLPLLVPHVL